MGNYCILPKECGFKFKESTFGIVQLFSLIYYINKIKLALFFIFLHLNISIVSETAFAPKFLLITGVNK